MSGRWIEVGDGVFARRYVELDQTLGLVVGDTHCLVIDTGTDEVHGASMAAAVRFVTPLPWTVVITHAHFDHFFGTKAFLPASVIAHERCRAEILAGGDLQRRAWAARFRSEGKAEQAERLATAKLVAPMEVITSSVQLDLGGRAVTLVHPGPAHTDHDVFVHVPDVDVVFAGDLVEQGAPPSVGPDAHASDWPAALDAILDLNPEIVVPGHGDPVDADFVRRQRDEIARGVF
ncbi:MBL fold metallo-hydrolase [Actinophytocola oryzae]|uniref:Glyoxylase-like metal-dependent hydrolase (Beta-lactamase superfamily II) n=1 Tax=Actinophytocola oryzae TaxID=502181 RepID=A0A4V6Q6H7_9PSEU|nr:MBL fold metallo-hydrolase [Actinophytocola oryzae]TDV38736.1 glyoxylase-like metal-dependent hydrolase (beta-lactamase superfamily II) [Actinophytocola oryzae]